RSGARLEQTTSLVSTAVRLPDATIWPPLPTVVSLAVPDASGRPPLDTVAFVAATMSVPETLLGVPPPTAAPDGVCTWPPKALPAPPLGTPPAAGAVAVSPLSTVACWLAGGGLSLVSLPHALPLPDAPTLQCDGSLAGQV